MGSVAHRLLEYLRPFLNHPFQNVRERIGSTLINIFENDLNFPGSEQTNFSPRIVELIESRAQEFELLRTQENINHGKTWNSSSLTFIDFLSFFTVIETETPFASAIRSFKTIAQWITGILNRCSNGNEVIYLELLAVGARLERCEHDTELAETCSAVLSMIAQALTLPRCMDSCLTKIDEISYSSSWSARLAIIDIMQVLVFHNMAIVLSRPEWVDKVLSVVLRLLEDNVLEVREKSAEVLGGLIHCSFLPTTEELLELFKKKCRTKVIKRSNRVTTSCAVEAATSASDNDNANAIRIRHCGVLGLCAFITAYPYEIPDFVPNVFEIISNHLNDPQPIPVSINREVSFRIFLIKFNLTDNNQENTRRFQTNPSWWLGFASTQVQWNAARCSHWPHGSTKLLRVDSRLNFSGVAKLSFISSFHQQMLRVPLNWFGKLYFILKVYS